MPAELTLRPPYGLNDCGFTVPTNHRRIRTARQLPVEVLSDSLMGLQLRINYSSGLIQIRAFKNMEKVFIGMGLGVLFLIVGLCIYVSRFRKWRRAARQLGLETCGMGFRGRPGICGRYGGVQIRVTTEWRWRTEKMVYEAQLPYALPPGLRMIHRNACPSIGEVNHDWQNEIGVPELDENYLIETLQPGAAAAFFRRTDGAEALARLHRVHGRVRIETSSLFIERDLFDSTDAIEATLYSLVDAVEKLAPEQNTPPQPSRTGEARGDGDGNDWTENGR